MRHRQDLGMSLVEVLVCLLIASLLLTGLMGGLIDVMSVSAITRAMASMLDQQRFVTNVFMHHVHQAGLSTCEPDLDQKNTWAIQGLSDDRAWPRWLTGAKSRSDGLLLQGCFWYQGRYQWMIEGLYVAKTSYTDNQGHRVYGLYQKFQGSRRQALATGVDRLAIQYGQLDHHGMITFVKGSQVNDWHDVRVINIRASFLWPPIIRANQADSSILNVQEYDIALRQ